MQASRAWALSLGLLLALPAAAQSEAERFSIGFEAGYQDLSSAKESAKAVFDGSTGGMTFGGSLRYAVARSFFVGAGLRTFSKEGERVFVADAGGPVYPLGHPLEIKLTSYYGLAGYRLQPEKALVPYLALGAGATSYKEDSTVGGLSESTSETKFSWHVMGGADYKLGRSFSIGVEARWTSVADAIGLGGVSAVYDETNLGGFSVAGRLAFRR